MLLGILAALTSAFTWGFSTILIKVGMKDKSPISANIFRLYTVALMYAVVFYFTGRFQELISLSPEFLLIAFISAQFGFVIGDYFYFAALKIMGVSRTVPITSTYPLWTIVWAIIFLGREINLQIVAGAVLVVEAIIIVRKADDGGGVDPRGFLFAILAPISWSIAITIMDWLSQHVEVLTLAGLRMLMAALGISLLLPKYAGEVRRISKREALLLAGAAFFGLFLGQYAFVYSVQTVGSEVAAPVSAINPIISSLLAILLLKEPANRRIIEALVLAVIGVILISTA